MGWWSETRLVSFGHVGGVWFVTAMTNPRPGDVTDGRARRTGGRLRGPPVPPARRRLPDARLRQRCRRRRPGGLAAPEPVRHLHRREPGRMAHDRRRARLARHAALSNGAARAACGHAPATADREPR